MNGVKTKGYKDLVVWKKAYELVLEVYKITKNYPKEEVYALTQQMRRCAISMPSNIAEGYGRQHNKEYKQFLSMALGSLCELETQYLLSIDLRYVQTDEKIQGLMKEVGAMLYRMINPIDPYRVSPIRYPLKGVQ